MRFRHAVVALFLLSVGVAAGCGGDDDSTADTSTSSTRAGAETSAPSMSSTSTTVPAGTLIEVRLADGDVAGGPRRETVALGDTVTIRATADADEEVHVHTYDLSVELSAGEPEEITFEATIPGRHEVEFERSGKLALTLEVR